MKKLQKATGSKIRSLRQKLDKNQETIARKLGISIPAYSKIESGLTDVNLSRLLQIATVYGVDAASLLPDVANRKPVQIDAAQYEAQIKVLHDQVISLQHKLIRAYEEIEKMKSRESGKK